MAERDQQGLVRYVEGCATTGILPTTHGWCEINGKVIDLTWGGMRNGFGAVGDLGYQEKGGWRSRVLGVPPKGWAYFGVDLTEALHDREGEDYGCSLLDDWVGGWPLLQQDRLKPLPPLDEAKIEEAERRAAPASLDAHRARKKTTP